MHAEPKPHAHGSCKVNTPTCQQRPADADLPGLQSHVRYSIFKDRRHVERFPRGEKRTGNLACFEWDVNLLFRGGLCSCSAGKIVALPSAVKCRQELSSNVMCGNLLAATACPSLPDLCPPHPARGATRGTKWARTGAQTDLRAGHRRRAMRYGSRACALRGRSPRARGRFHRAGRYPGAWPR